MACSLYNNNNNGYGCGGCVHFVKTNSVTVQGVTKELKEINRMCEQLNGTGYDVIAIHSVQDKYHNKYKNKYNDTYTDKWKKKETKHNKTNK